MAITPADIENLTFSEAKKGGYNAEEVDSFLEELSGELDAMLKKIADLKGRLTASDQALEAAHSQITQLQTQLAEKGDAPAEVAAPSAAVSDAVAATERQISQALIVAQQSAEHIISDAKETADKIRTEADQKAREVIRQALAEKQGELDEIDRLKTSCEAFRTEYHKLLQHFMDEAETAFPADMLKSIKGDSKADKPSKSSKKDDSDIPSTKYVQPNLGGMGLDDLD